MALVALSKLIKDAGFPNVEDTEGMVWAESSANPENYNHTPCAPNENAVGLLQVCTVHCGTQGLPADKDACVKALKHPRTNLRVAKGIYDAAGGTFAKDWPTWRDGSYRKARGRDKLIFVTDEPSDVAGNLGGDLSDQAANAAGAVLGPLDEIASALLSPDTWFRVGKGLLGAVLIVLGTGAIVFIVANKTSNSPTGRVAKKIVTKGALK